MSKKTRATKDYSQKFHADDAPAAFTKQGYIIYGNTDSISFAEYVDKWLTVYKANKLKPSTIATYKKHLHAHVLPASGLRAISSITTEDIQLFLNERKHLARKTLSSMRHFMGEIFKDAVEDGLIKKDPTASRRITIPSDKSCTR